MTSPLSKNKKVGIDCRLAGLIHAGIGRYIENLVLHLLGLKSDINWVLFFHDKKQAQEVLKNRFGQENITIVYTPIKHYSLAEQLQLPKIFSQEKLDLLHVPHFNAPLFYKRKIVLTIHDLLWHEQRGASVTTLNKWLYWIKYVGYKIITFFSTKKALKIFVPSNTIKKTLSKYYPQTKNKIVVTKEGIASHFKSTSQRKTTSHQLVYTGSLYPHKNLQLIIHALKLLPDFQLLIIGSRNVFQEKTRQLIKELKLEKQIKFAGYLTDQELLKTYHNSLALVQPSLSEGFGLTGIEAMASGLPVLASDIEVFREIYQDAALYFSPHSTQSFIENLEKLTPAKQESLIKKGLKVSKQYNWEKMAQDTLQFFQDVY